jgi:hypothetical protein
VSADALEAPSTIADAISRLAESRRTLAGTVDGVGEDVFYELRPVGHEEYSVLSVLENVVSHDAEHEHQIRRLIER